MNGEHAAIIDFINKWKSSRDISLTQDISPSEMLLCQNDWMQSETFGRLYGWRLVRQNIEQAKIWDRLQEDRRQRERDDAILISELPPK